MLRHALRAQRSLRCLTVRYNSVNAQTLPADDILEYQPELPQRSILTTISEIGPETLDITNYKYKITPSLFKKYGSNRPATISFVPDENAQEITHTNYLEVIQKHPNFKLNNYHYSSLRNSFLGAGLIRVGSAYDVGGIIDPNTEEAKELLDIRWNIFWGRHLQPEQYKYINEFQKVNHFPGSSNLGRKDFLNIHLTRALYKHGREEYGFFPETFLLDFDLQRFQNRIAKANTSDIFIMKPFNSSCGRGISLMRPTDPIPKNCLVQDYIHNPYLINGHKFDLRLYVLASSVDPLKLYIHQDGLVRFATQQYNNDTIDTRLAHLTNYSLNRYSSEFVKNKDATDDNFGHKWSVKALKKYMEAEVGVEKHEKLWSEIHDLIVKTMISVEGLIRQRMEERSAHKNSCFELYGFDVMFDTNLKPWLIEVNTMPSLSVSSPLDRKIKEQVLTESFHILGMVPYERQNYENQVEALLKYDSHRLSPDHYVIHQAEDELHRTREYTRIFPPTEGDPARYNHLFKELVHNNELLVDFETKKRNTNVTELHASIA
jgi:hypothetical protein